MVEDNLDFGVSISITKIIIQQPLHSMPIKKLVYEKEKIYTRNYFPSDNRETNYVNFHSASMKLKMKKKLYSLGGYNVVMDKKDNPLSYGI